MNIIKKYVYIFFFIILCMLYNNCLPIIDQQAISAKESADKAFAEAKAAELNKGAKFENPDEKIRTILEKAMSALNSAQAAMSTADSILQDKEQSAESRTLANEAKKLAMQAIKKAGSVLNAL